MSREFIDRRGQRFGKLLVLRRVRGTKTKKGQCTQYLVLCDCGIKKTIRQTGLLAKRSAISCGCTNARKKYLFNGYGTKEYHMLDGARTRAKRLRVPFSLIPEDINIPKRCPLLGIPLRFAIGRPNGNSPSLDRIIPKLGYTKENSIVISYRANMLKNDATLKELKLMVKNLEKIWPSFT